MDKFYVNELIYYFKIFIINFFFYFHLLYFIFYLLLGESSFK